jgi:hypothetical protein
VRITNDQRTPPNRLLIEVGDAVADGYESSGVTHAPPLDGIADALLETHVERARATVVAEH